MKTWIAVANRCEARFFELDSEEKDQKKNLRLIQKLENPKGRLKGSEINADRPGSAGAPAFDHRTSLTNPQDPTERVAQIFAKSISETLDREKSNHAYDELILVAEPHFLGKMKAALSKQVTNTLVRTLNKDLGNMPDHQVQIYLHKDQMKETALPLEV